MCSAKIEPIVYACYDLTFCRLLGGSLGLQLKSFPHAWTDGQNSYIAGLVHVGEEPGDGNVADGLLEEHLLYGGRADRAERRQEQQQLPKATGLSRVPGRDASGGQKAKSKFYSCCPKHKSQFTFGCFTA